MRRLLIAATALIAAASLGAASCDAVPQRPTANDPTRLDYLLLASLADSQQLLFMAGYQPTRQK